jgi:hypothetical protein
VPSQYLKYLLKQGGHIKDIKSSSGQDIESVDKLLFFRPGSYRWYFKINLLYAEQIRLNVCLNVDQLRQLLFSIGLKNPPRRYFILEKSQRQKDMTLQTGGRSMYHCYKSHRVFCIISFSLFCVML